MTEFVASPVAGIWLLGLWNADLGGVFARRKSTANLLGRLSYPLFLVHWPIGAVIAGAFGWEQGWPLAIVAGAASLAVTVLVLWGVEEPLMRVRSSIRQGAASC